MKAIDYLREKQRMCDKLYRNGCNDCPLSRINNRLDVNCRRLQDKFPEQAVEIVEKWAKENPVKTYLSVLLEKFPNAQLNVNRVPVFCVQSIFDIVVACPESKNCKECWNREYEED